MSDQEFLTNSCNLIPNGKRCLEPLRSQAWLSAPRHEREGNTSEVKKSVMTICEKRFFRGSGGNSKKIPIFQRNMFAQGEKAHRGKREIHLQI